MEQADGMTGKQHERLLVGQSFKVLLDEAVLHPILADGARLSVCDEFIGVERDFEIEVIVDHDLEGFALDTLPLIRVDRLAVDSPLWAESIAVYFTVFFQFN